MKIFTTLKAFLHKKTLKEKFFYILLGFVLLKVVKTSSKICRICYRSFIRKPKNLRERYGSNSWAVVTGSGDGLGKGFCLELASQGFNIALLSRNYDKNEDLIREIGQINRTVQTINIGIDFKESNRQKFFDLLFDKLAHLDISLLVNNVGKFDLDHFETQDEKEIHEIMSINCFPVVFLTRKLIPNMKNRSKRSAVINISSLIAAKPCPYMAVFAASKAFVESFSLGLAKEENISQKIDVLNLRVFQVSTNLIGNVKGFWILEPEECAKACLEKLGFENNSCGHWKHEFVNIVYEELPETLRMGFFSHQIKKSDEIMG